MDSKKINFLDSDLQRRLLIGKRLAQSNMVLHVTWIFVGFWLKVDPIAWLLVATTPMYFVVFLLIQKKRIVGATWCFYTSVILIITIASGLVRMDGNAEVMMLFMVGIPFILLDQEKDRIHLRVMPFLPIVCYVALLLVDFKAVHYPPEFAEETSQLVQMFSTISCFILISIQFNYVDLISSRYQRKLRRTSLELEEKGRIKEEFMAHISHELRTPLHAIHGLTLLLEKQVKPEQARRVQAIRESGELMLALVNDILDFSKLSGSGMEVRRETVDVRNFSESLVLRFADMAEQKGIRLEVNYAGKELVETDPRHLDQIANNLVSNSVKFTEAGLVQVNITTKPTANGRIQLTLEVRDEGKGIPAHLHDKIFEPFNQGAKDTSISYGGTGLGLPIARSIAEGMGGSLTLKQSVPGETRFVLELTVNKGNAAISASTSGEAPLFRHQQVLVVDDNPLNRMVMEEFLQVHGLKVSLSTSGDEALERDDLDVFDAMLMDLRMPGTDGFATSQLLRERGLSTPIVALTASSFEEVSGRLSACGINAFETKPFNPERLLTTLKNLMIPRIEERPQHATGSSGRAS